MKFQVGFAVHATSKVNAMSSKFEIVFYLVPSPISGPQIDG